MKEEERRIMVNAIQEGVTLSSEQLRIDQVQDSRPNVSGRVECQNDLHFTLAEKRAEREEMCR